jgi:hypothetical protein
MQNYLDALSIDLRLVDMGVYVEQLLQKKAISPKKMAQRINVPYRSLMNYIRNTRALPLGVAFQLIKVISNSKLEEKAYMDELFQKSAWIKSSASTSNLVKLPKQFSKELAYLIGAIHDGTVFANATKNQYVVQFWQINNSRWLETVADKLEKVFSCRPKRYEEYVQLANKAAYEFFAKVIGVKQRQGEWDSFLKVVPRNLQLYAIAGLFDAEGWVGAKQDLRIKISQGNLAKLIETKKVLRLHNIGSGEVISENGGYALWLCGENCKDFAAGVGKFSEHLIKRGKLSDLIVSKAANPVIEGS